MAILSGFFGALALVIAALGLYGVTSYTVNRRVTEIGIRRALGAQGAHVLSLVRSLRGLLFGLAPLDPGTFIGVAALFAIVARLAALLPAHRATRVDPLVALRNEEPREPRARLSVRATIQRFAFRAMLSARHDAQGMARAS